LKSKACK